jgi:hypothetical protein
VPARSSCRFPLGGRHDSRRLRFAPRDPYETPRRSGFGRSRRALPTGWEPGNEPGRRTGSVVAMTGGRESELEVAAYVQRQERRSQEAFAKVDVGTIAHRRLEQQYRADSEVEILLVGADSIDTIRRTHGHYFEGAALLSRSEGMLPPWSRHHVVPSGGPDDQINKCCQADLLRCGIRYRARVGPRWRSGSGSRRRRAAPGDR